MQIQITEHWQAQFVKTIRGRPRLQAIRRLGKPWQGPEATPEYVAGFLTLDTQSISFPYDCTCTWEELKEEGATPNHILTFSVKRRVEFPQPPGLPPTPNQKKTLRTLEKRIAAIGKRPPVPLANIFEYAPEEDFHWGDGECGDWHVYSFEQDDGTIGWDKIAYETTMARKGGKRRVTLRSVDTEGNWDIDYNWDEALGDTEANFYMEDQTDNYFKGWAEYWIAAARSGDDPLGEYFGMPIHPRRWVGMCIRAAKDALKYLTMGRQSDGTA